MVLWIERIGRYCIALLFIAGTLQKLVDPDVAQALLAMRGWPVWLMWPALALNAVGAALLVAGIFPGPVGITLALYCGVTSYFHFLPQDPWQMSIVVKNWATAGGLLLVAARGAERGFWRP